MAATNAGFVNINSDLGESFGPWVMGNDAEVLKIVKSANVACGFHASDPVVMVDTVKLCQQNGVSIGASSISRSRSSRPTSPTRSVRCRRSRRCTAPRSRT